MSFKPVTHVLFDMDGLLLDSEGIYKEMIGSIAKKYGGEYTEDVRLKILGRKQQDTATIAVREMKLSCTEEQFLEEYRQMYMIRLTDVTLMPGADRLIRHLHKNNVPIAVATSAGADSIEAKRTHHTELFALFHHIVSGTSDPEVKEGKPNPDIFLVCASRFPDKPDPSKCLVFEDAPNGVQAGIAAGMQVVMVPDPTIDKKHTLQATLVLKSLEDFKPELFGLPPF